VLLGRTNAEAARLATLETMLESWDENLALAQAVALEAATPAGSKATSIARRPFDSLTVLPPVSRPPAIRDAYCFEEHVKNARARRGLAVPQEWYEIPVFYFSNPGALVGHRAAVRKPDWTEALDYELELGWVISRKVRDVREDEWRSVVAGFTILNDWSARDVQRREMAVGLGPAKGKDFATAIGPVLVTPDEIADPYNLGMRARVNGETWSEGNSGSMHHRFDRMIEFASMDETLRPGDLIGSGTVTGGCGLELDRWVKPGDVIELEIDGIGKLVNTVVRP
jgi:2-keto-4-pentenoate hydratase/2-oxohepta-3-ene-1,7-dioic acid hydratase in catechol pathway